MARLPVQIRVSSFPCSIFSCEEQLLSPLGRCCSILLLLEDGWMDGWKNCCSTVRGGDAATFSCHHRQWATLGGYRDNSKRTSTRWAEQTPPGCRGESTLCCYRVCVMMQKLESQTEVAKVLQMGDTGKALVEATPTLTCQPLLRHESEVQCQHQSC